MYCKYFKRILDLTVSLIILIFTSPLILIIILLLFISNRGKVFFIQPRIGKDGKIFNVIKFKTMNDRKDRNNKLLPDCNRITPIGNFIRKTSLDEFPQLLNVLKGDLSIVGPRPLLVEYLPLYNDFQKRRHEIKPGITGWAQVNGRNNLSWNKRFEFDVWYIDNVTFLLDCTIMFKTIMKVIRSEGISSRTSVTMEKFKGN